MIVQCSVTLSYLQRVPLTPSTSAEMCQNRSRQRKKEAEKPISKSGVATNNLFSFWLLCERFFSRSLSLWNGEKENDPRQKRWRSLSLSFTPCRVESCFIEREREGKGKASWVLSLLYSWVQRNYFFSLSLPLSELSHSMHTDIWHRTDERISYAPAGIRGFCVCLLIKNKSFKNAEHATVNGIVTG